MHARVGTLLAIAAATCLFALTALPARAADPKEEGWQPVTTQMIQAGEGFEAKNLVGVAYGFIWVMVAGFVFSVWRRTDRLEKEIEALREQMKQARPRAK